MRFFFNIKLLFFYLNFCAALKTNSISCIPSQSYNIELVEGSYCISSLRYLQFLLTFQCDLCEFSTIDTQKFCPYLSSVPCTSCRCCPSRSHCCPHWTRPLSASLWGAPLHCSQDQGHPPRSGLVGAHDYQMTPPLPCTFQDCSCLSQWLSLFWQYLNLAAHHLFLYWR